MHRLRLACVILTCVMLAAVSVAVAAEPPVRGLFLVDGGHHQPAERFGQLEPVLESRGIELVYTERIAGSPLMELSPKAAAPDESVAIRRVDVP